METELATELIAELDNIGGWLGWIATWLFCLFIVLAFNAGPTVKNVIKKDDL